jgi:hypothetical protein
LASAPKVVAEAVDQGLIAQHADIFTKCPSGFGSVRGRLASPHPRRD